MIELSRMHITDYNGVIETRRKVYYLALDLQLSTHTATCLATFASEILNAILVEQKSLDVTFAFSKERGYYQLHLFISCPEATYQRLKAMYIFRDIHFCVFDNQQSYIELKTMISDPSFIPNESFLQNERERLIQQSSGEMLQEIRQKNRALHQALHDLEASSAMIQTEKMRALGSMTAGVAHELNNPMMGILNFIQYAIKHTDEQDRRYRPLIDAEREVLRCQDIITNLLTFSRMEAEGEEAFAMIKPSVLFERILKLLTYRLQSTNIHIHRHFPKSEPEIKMKVNKIQQVILNLITNAIDAMQDREKKELTLTIKSNTERVLMTVCDTGSGIDEETLDRMFDPFFTTKKAGEGTGLGLSVSRSIIEEHSGHLTYETKLGRGSCFTVTLPIILNKNQRSNEHA